MASIKLTGDTSGEITISAPAVAGTNTLTLPADTGTFMTSTYTGGDVDIDSGTLHVDATNDRVGIGTSSPSHDLQIGNNTSVSTSTPKTISLGGTYSDTAANNLKFQVWTDGSDFIGTGVSASAVDYVVSNTSFRHNFYVGTATRASIENAVTAIGKAGAYNGLEVYNVSGGTNVYRSVTGGGIIHFSSDVGGTKTLKSYINETGGLASASDYRLKENIIPVDNATETIKLLNPVHFNFIGLDKQQSGFIAHELKDVIPHMVDGDKDQLKEDGTPFIQMVDHTSLIPYLTKALQEAITKIEDLETRIEALENA